MRIERISAVAAFAIVVGACTTPQPVSQGGSGGTVSIPMPSRSSSTSQGAPSPQQGSQGGIPGQQGSQGGMPGSQGSQGGMPGSQGSQAGIPGSQGSQGGLPGSQGSQSGSIGGGSQAGSMGGGGNAPMGGAPIPIGGQGASGGTQGSQGGQGTQAGQGGEDDLFGPESFGGDGRSANSGSGSGDAFGESLEEFDQAMGREQDALARAGGGQAADAVLDEAGGAGGAAAGGGEVDSQRAGGGPGGAAASEGGENIPDPRAVAAANGPGVEGCTDTDNTARQLCEIASAETDAFVKGELWREYEEYVRILEDTPRRR